MNLDDVSLNRVKSEIINKILDDLTSTEQYTEQEAKLKRAELEQQILDKELICSLSLQSEVTDAQKFNQTAEEMYIDILTTFGYVNTLEDTIDKHIEINQSTINNLTALINKANDRIDGYEAILGAKGNPEHNIEGFRTSDSFENKRELFTERYGEIVPSSCRAYYNLAEESISLPYTRQQNMITYKNDVSLGDIFISKQLGGGLIKVRNGENSLENIIDTSLHTYWSETIMCDEPMRVKFDDVRPTDPHEVENFYYGVKNGALCELEINFESIAKVNEISFLPYGQYPVEIVAIRYKTSDDTEEPVKEVVYPDNTNPLLKNKVIGRGGTYRFPEINCKVLYIIFNQIHYTKSTFLLSSNELFKNELWFSATGQDDSKPVLDDGVLFKPMYFDRAIMDSAWKYINNMTVKNKKMDIKQILFGQADNIKPVTKYQYNYGFYNIAPNFSEFERTGVYVSKFIQASGNIKNIRIVTDEEHPQLPDNTKLTDIEYYISYKDNPEWDDWHPILPVNVPTVECELLQTEASLCELRFPAEAVHGVYLNGNPLIKDTDYFVHTNSEGFIHAVDIPNFDYFVKYTVSYTPAPDARTLDLMPDNVPLLSNSFEVINGDDTSGYLLNEYPYFSADNKIATNVKLVNKFTGAVISQDSGDVVCVTDPYSTMESYKNFDRTNSKIQYYTDKNAIYFNQNITKDFDIEINYQHFVSKVRLKAIFRRNSLKNNWMTPTLSKIKYEFVTVD
jgi:hypothetical protein